MLKLGVRTVSSFCSADKPQCVEVTYTYESIEVRDTKLGKSSPVVTFTDSSWRAFIANAATLDGTTPRVGELQFTADEWHAFIVGVKRGDFDIPSGSPAVTTVVKAEPEVTPV